MNEVELEFAKCIVSVLMRFDGVLLAITLGYAFCVRVIRRDDGEMVRYLYNAFKLAMILAFLNVVYAYMEKWYGIFIMLSDLP